MLFEHGIAQVCQTFCHGAGRKIWELNAISQRQQRAGVLMMMMPISSDRFGISWLTASG